MRRVYEMVYEARDGQKFFSEYDCSLHETELRLKAEGEELLARQVQLKKDIAHFCSKYISEEFDEYEGVTVCVSKDCPFYCDKSSCRCGFEDFPCYG